MLRVLLAGAWLGLCAGCGARTTVDVDSAGGSSAACEEIEVTGVPECSRPSPEALPLARIGPAPGGGLPGEQGSGFHLGSDGESLYFASEGRIFRVSMAGGAPEPLTPPHSAGGFVQFADGFVYWQHQDVVWRVPADGGEVEPLLELAGEMAWTTAPHSILSWHVSEVGTPLYRTSLSTGETSELWSGHPEQDIERVRADAEHAYVATEFDLYRVPLQGGPAELLLGNGGAPGPWPRVLGADLLVTGDHVYFGGNDGPPSPPYGVFRIAKATAPAPELELVLPGFPVRMVAHGGALFADVVVPPGIGEPKAHGAIVRAPLDGAAVEVIADSDSYSQGGAIAAYSAAGLAASDCHVYFILRCEDEPTYRIVSLPYGAGADGP